MKDIKKKCQIDRLTLISEIYSLKIRLITGSIIILSKLKMLISDGYIAEILTC